MHRTAPSYIRSDYLSLWLGRAVAAAIARDQDGRILVAARDGLARMRANEGGGARYYDRWEAAIKAGPEAVMALLCDTSEEAQALRSSSPFFATGAFSPGERDAILEAFRTWWKTQATEGDFLLENSPRR
jgi:hypothetical protein